MAQKSQSVLGLSPNNISVVANRQYSLDQLFQIVSATDPNWPPSGLPDVITNPETFAPIQYWGSAVGIIFAAVNLPDYIAGGLSNNFYSMTGFGITGTAYDGASPGSAEESAPFSSIMVTFTPAYIQEFAGSLQGFDPFDPTVTWDMFQDLAPGFSAPLFIPDDGFFFATISISNPFEAATILLVEDADAAIVSTPSTGAIDFTDTNPYAVPTGIIQTQTVSVTDALGNDITSKITPTELSLLESDFQITAGPDNTNTGAIDWTYNPQGTGLNFLLKGETAVVTSTIQISDGDGKPVTASVSIAIQGDTPPLFSSAADDVDFNSLAPVQVAAVNAGADLYNSLGGDDVVILPNVADYQLTSTVVWDPSQIFTLGGGADDTLTGGDGNYNVTLGDGNDSVAVGGGTDSITFGSGKGAVTLGEGTDTLSGFQAVDNFSLIGSPNLDDTIVISQTGDTYLYYLADTAAPIDLTLIGSYNPDNFVANDGNITYQNNNSTEIYNGLNTHIYDISDAFNYFTNDPAITKLVFDLSKEYLSIAEQVTETVFNFLSEFSTYDAIPALGQAAEKIPALSIATATLNLSYDWTSFIYQWATTGEHDWNEILTKTAEDFAGLVPGGGYAVAIGDFVVEKLMDAYFDLEDQYLLEQQASPPIQVLTPNAPNGPSIILLNQENQAPNLPQSGSGDVVITSVSLLTAPDSVSEIIGNSAANLTLRGNSLDNVIVAGSGNDVLSGGGGADTFVIGVGTDEIMDFSASDRIEAYTPNAVILRQSSANGETTLGIDTAGDGLIHATIVIDGVTGTFTTATSGDATFFATSSMVLSAALLMTNTTGALVVDQIANSNIAYELIGGLGPEWEFDGSGANLLGDGNAGFLIRDTGTVNPGALFVGEVANGAATYTPIGGLGLEWQFGGNAEFLGTGQSEFLIRNTGTVEPGTLDLGQVIGGSVQYTQVGGLGLEWEFDGTGDFLGDGNQGFLIRNIGSAEPGAFDVGELINGAVQYTPIGGVGPEWDFEGTGDFLGDGNTGFLLWNSGSAELGTMAIGEVVSGQLQFTDIDSNKTDFLLRNTGSGALVVASVSGSTGNASVAFTTVGAIGPEWTFHNTNPALMA